MLTTIIGAGVSGLTVATVLLERGWHDDGDTVRIVAAAPFEATVSSVAAAVWTMTDTDPLDLSMARASVSRARFAALARVDGSGVRPLRQRELSRTAPDATPWESTPWVRRLRIDDVPEGYAGGFLIEGFSIDPGQYLPFLRDRLLRVGVRIDTGFVTDLDDVDGDLIINCTGLGARELVGDELLQPIRGQVVIVEHPGLFDGVSDETDPDRITYVYPRGHEVVLGGERSVGDESTDVDDALAERIRRDSASLDPRVEHAPTSRVRVGLRPGRPTVRLEAETLSDGRTVIHDYGHGGAGYILSWGCADEVEHLARTTIGDQAARDRVTARPGNVTPSG